MEIVSLFFYNPMCLVVEKMCDRDSKLHVVTYCRTLIALIQKWRAGNYTLSVTDRHYHSISFVTTPPLESNEEQAAHPWVLRRVTINITLIKRLLVIVEGPYPGARTKRLEVWASLDRVLSQVAHLQSIDLFCGTKEEDSEESFNEAVSEMRSVLPTVGSKIHGTYSATVEYGQDIAPDLFGSEWCRPT